MSPTTSVWKLASAAINDCFNSCSELLPDCSMSWLKGKRVAYVPYSPDLSAPGDRRRFVRYAALRDIRFEVFRHGENYDLVVLSSVADVTHFSRFPRGGPPLV